MAVSRVCFFTEFLSLCDVLSPTDFSRQRLKDRWFTDLKDFFSSFLMSSRLRRNRSTDDTDVTPTEFSLSPLRGSGCVGDSCTGVDTPACVMSSLRDYRLSEAKKSGGDKNNL